MTEIINTLLDLSQTLGYGGIIILMAVESSFIPFPSEVVIPPAAYLAAQGEMNIFLVIFAGMAGSLLGASINYFLALTLGRKVVYGLAASRWAKFLLINEKKLARAENYFLRYGKASTFFGRLVPAVRQLISIPAGFSRMNFKSFIFFTWLGSGLWVIVLAVLGYLFGANQERLALYYREISLIFVLAGVAAGVYLYFRTKRQTKKG
jgi:membrane protein DedA with SNARE-associated domain